MERSQSGTNFLCVCLCACVLVCAWGHPPGTGSMQGLALPTDSFGFIFVEIWTHFYQQQTRLKGT